MATPAEPGVAEVMWVSNWTEALELGGGELDDPKTVVEREVSVESDPRSA